MKRTGVFRAIIPVSFIVFFFFVNGGCSHIEKSSIPITKQELAAKGKDCWGEYFQLYLQGYVGDEASPQLRERVEGQEPEDIGEAILFYSNIVGDISALASTYIVRPLNFRTGALFEKAERFANKNEDAGAMFDVEYRTDSPTSKEQLEKTNTPVKELTENEKNIFDNNYSYLAGAMFICKTVCEDSRQLLNITKRLIKDKAYNNKTREKTVEKLINNQHYLEWILNDSKQKGRHNEGLLITFQRVATFTATPLTSKKKIMDYLSKEILETQTQNEENIRFIRLRYNK